MAYLTNDEFKTLNEFSSVKDDDFEKLEYYSELALDNITFGFYQKNDLASDPATFRQSQFKKAMALEIEYLNSRGVLTQSDVDSENQLSSQNIGGISLSLNPNQQAQSVVASEVLQILQPTGLLYRGVQ